MNKVYSLNNEEFSDYDSIVDELLNEYLPGTKVTIYEGDPVQRKHSDFIWCSSIIDDMIERAYEDADDHADGYLLEFRNVEGFEKIKELNSVISEWFDKNAAQPKFYAVKNVKEIEITL